MHIINHNLLEQTLNNQMLHFDNGNWHWEYQLFFVQSGGYQFTLLRYINFYSLSFLNNTQILFLIIMKGSCGSRHWKASNRIWNGSLFLCGMLVFPTFECQLFEFIWFLSLLHSMFLCCKVPVFIAEIAPKNLRGSLTAANQVAIANHFILYKSHMLLA